MDRGLTRPRPFRDEELITKIWRDLIGFSIFGVDDSFYDVGGHSLLLARVRDRIRAALKIDVDFAEMLHHLTVRALAKHVDALAEGSRENDDHSP